VNLYAKRVLLTGASSGIGLALSRAFAARGSVLAIASRRPERLARISEELASSNPGIRAPLPLACDVREEVSVRHCIGAAVETLGGIDILVNNAGISVYGAAERTSFEDFQSLIEVNLYGPVRTMLEVLPFMKRQGGGLIVNVATVAAIHGVPYLGAYGASKSALITLSQSMRAELAGGGVEIMLVYPDYTESGIFDSEKKVGGAHRPPGPYADADEVAEAIVKGMEADKRELVLSFRGRMLATIGGVMPGLVERSMRRMAEELGGDDEEELGGDDEERS
jgi:short-subunit dehydrogenase